MSTLRLGDIAPDFEQDSSLGRIHFHHWLGNSWGVLFSHPADFTPVCTTELGMTAKLSNEFAQRNVKVLALSVDSAESHNSGFPISMKRKIRKYIFRFWPMKIVKCPRYMT